MSDDNMHIKFWSKSLREGDHLGEPGIDWKIILNGY
jgi:hypothetical protein